MFSTVSIRGCAMLAWMAAAPFVSGCLPGDTRPTPGSVFITAAPSPEVLSGFVTTDGWRISFDKLLVNLGMAVLNDLDTAGSCNSDAYQGELYARLLDVTGPGQQKVEEVFGLGTCSLALNLGGVSPKLRGVGVTDEDVALMRESDLSGSLCALADVRDAGYSSLASVYVSGQASRGASTVRFAWAFPEWFRLYGCPTSDGYGVASDFRLSGGDALRVAIVVHGEELFRANGHEGSGRRFDAIAAADANGDHIVTLEELFAVPAVDPPDDLFPALCAPSAPTMADILGTERLPSMIRINGSGRCQIDYTLEIAHQ